MPQYRTPVRREGRGNSSARSRRGANASQPGCSPPQMPAANNQQYGRVTRVSSGTTYQVIVPDTLVIIDTAGSIAITLPPVDKYVGEELVIKNTASANFSIQPTSGEKLEDVTDNILVFDGADKRSIRFRAEGGASPGWWIISEYPDGTTSHSLSFTLTTNTTSLAYQLIVATGINWSVDWGDGSTSNYVGDGAIENIAHSYAAGSYTSVFTFEHPTSTSLIRFVCSHQKLTGTVPSFFAHYGVDKMQINSSAALGGSFPSMSHMSDLSDIDIYQNALSGPLPAFPNSTLLLNIHMYSNAHTGDIPDFSGITNLTWFMVFDNALTGYAGSSFPAGLIHFRADDNALSEAAVNAILVQLDALGTSGGTCELDNPGAGTNAAPSGAGSTAKTNLIGRGWTVNTA